MSESIYELLSEERKKLQESGELPEWYSTGGWQLFKSKYKFDKIASAKTFKFDIDSPDFDLDYARLRSAVFAHCKRNGCKLSCKKVSKGILVTRI